MNEGDDVEFDVTSADNRSFATNVKIVNTSVTDAQREAFTERANARRVR